MIKQVYLNRNITTGLGYIEGILLSDRMDHYRAPIGWAYNIFRDQMDLACSE